MPSRVPDEEIPDWTPSAVVEQDGNGPCQEEDNRWVGKVRNFDRLGELTGMRDKFGTIDGFRVTQRKG